MFGKALGHSLRTACLNVALFGGGETFFVQRLAEKKGMRPVAVHGTYIYAKQIGKMHRFKEEGLWIDEDDYYTPGNTQGFITFDNLVPEHMIEEAIPEEIDKGWGYLEGQFKLIHY